VSSEDHLFCYTQDGRRCRPMALTPDAQAVMCRLGDRYATHGFPNPWTWLIAKDDFEGAVDGLIAVGLVLQKKEMRGT
jgi:hypothetical protein